MYLKTYGVLLGFSRVFLGRRPIPTRPVQVIRQLVNDLYSYGIWTIVDFHQDFNGRWSRVESKPEVFFGGFYLFFWGGFGWFSGF